MVAKLEGRGVKSFFFAAFLSFLGTKFALLQNERRSSKVMYLVTTTTKKIKTGNAERRQH